jgi:hypothetical protein
MKDLDDKLRAIFLQEEIFADEAIAQIKQAFEEAGYADTSDIRITAGIKINFEPELMTGQEWLKIMRDHYWDSLEPQRDLILRHIEGAINANRKAAGLTDD